jgi:protein-tyrosine-phosphatase
MLAAVLQRELKNVGRTIAAESAGHSAVSGMPAAGEWAALAGQTRIDLSRHRSRRVDGIGDLGKFDVVICVDEGATKTVTKLGVKPKRILVMEIIDPYGQGRKAYEDCYRTIVANVAGLIAAKSPGR